LPKGTISRTIPAASYAVIETKGEMPFALMEAHEYLRETWLPNSAYERATTPSFEVYAEKAWEVSEPEIDIFVPVVVR